MSIFRLVFSAILLALAWFAGSGRHTDPWGDLFTFLECVTAVLVLMLSEIMDAIREQHK